MAEFNRTLCEKLFLILFNFLLKVTLCERVTSSDAEPMRRDFLGSLWRREQYVFSGDLSRHLHLALINNDRYRKGKLRISSICALQSLLIAFASHFHIWALQKCTINIPGTHLTVSLCKNLCDANWIMRFFFFCKLQAISGLCASQRFCICMYRNIHGHMLCQDIWACLNENESQDKPIIKAMKCVTAHKRMLFPPTFNRQHGEQLLITLQ